MSYIADFGYKQSWYRDVGVIFFLIKSLQGFSILLVNPAWDGISGLVAYVLLGERFDDPYKYIGIVFIVIGLFFLKLPVVNERKFVFPKLFQE
jgi:hypothetical protein